MQLLLLRHADAVDDAPSDRQRTLSEKGHAQACRCAKFCQRADLTADVVLTSPYVRARETAEPVAAALGAELIEEKFLAPGMSPETALEELAAYSKFEGVMLVGHEPDFSMLTAFLIGLRTDESVYIRKCSLTCITLPELSAGKGVLEFLTPAKLMK
jgi:phosphohistidine phosphatase